MKKSIKDSFSETWDYYPNSFMLEKWKFIPPRVFWILTFLMFAFGIFAVIFSIVAEAK